MKPIVAVIAPGAMGSAVGALLVDHGLEVTTTLAGRSAASAARAHKAGMKPVPDEDVVRADFVLSIVPPADALSLAEKLAPLLGSNNRKPLYVDCNAVSPPTVERIAAIIADTGAPFVDAGIIGPPPKPGGKPTAFYASGADAPRFATLRDFGLDVRVIEGPIGAASALKMSYAGITKGITALASAMMLAATRAGTAQALQRELSQSQPELLAWFTRQIPLMYSKAYRWVAEMEEIAGFVGEDKAAREMFDGTARFYERIARDEESSKQETQALSTFLKANS
jgi:3-hydroxyisobutyrate dehydrogenase-like beta-hydroxyacid dehydrogenase